MAHPAAGLLACSSCRQPESASAALRHAAGPTAPRNAEAAAAADAAADAAAATDAPDAADEADATDARDVPDANEDTDARHVKDCEHDSREGESIEGDEDKVDEDYADAGDVNMVQEDCESSKCAALSPMTSSMGQEAVDGDRTEGDTGSPVHCESGLANHLDDAVPSGDWVAWSRREGLCMAVEGQAEGSWAHANDEYVSSSRSAAAIAAAPSAAAA